MEKVQGIVYAYTPEKRYDMVRDLGIDWIRLNVPFPWTDRLDGTISPRWESVKAAIREAAEAGLSVMPSTPTILDYPESICGPTVRRAFTTRYGGRRGLWQRISVRSRRRCGSA